MIYLRYNREPLTLDRNRRYVQDKNVFSGTKPVGFWLTDDTENCWRSWCVAEGFMLENLTHCHEVILNEERILFLRSALDIDVFTERYGNERELFPGYRERVIDWHRVTQDHSGLVITPYIFERRLHDGNGSSWYYGWDCASGCIWDLNAIVSVTLLDTSNPTEILREYTVAGETP